MPAAVGAALGAALGAAGAGPGDVEAAVFGLAGVDWPTDAPRIDALLDGHVPPAPRRIVNDAFVVLRAGASESWGIGLVAGTGTVAVGRDPIGNEFRTIGEGRVFGDFGDEFDVSDLAVEAVANAFTGRGPATLLTEMLCQRLGEDSAEALLERLARQDPFGRSTDLQNLSNLPVEVVLAGGLFRTPNRYLLDELELGVRRTAPRAEICPLTCPPVVGAALLAMEVAQVPITGNAAAQLRADVTAHFWASQR
jgi:hypothetical protein